MDAPSSVNTTGLPFELPIMKTALETNCATVKASYYRVIRNLGPRNCAIRESAMGKDVLLSADDRP